MDNLQSRIRKITSDTSLSDAEKMKRVQLLYASVPPTASSSTSSPSHQSAVESTPCQHYIRNADVEAPCCKSFVSCRICHDQQVTDHTLVRASSMNMRCRQCGLIQPVSDQCNNTNCTWKTTRYWCEPCRLWEDNPGKPIFHCDGCGICRVGNRESYFHCDSCNLCQPIEQKEHHKCIKNVAMDACPICQVPDMRYSTVRIVMLPCGHALHETCEAELRRSGNPICPQCRKSVCRDADQEAFFARIIATTPMPPEFAGTRAEILCNDCEKKCEVPYHWQGHVCSSCGSLNTSILRSIRVG